MRNKKAKAVRKFIDQRFDASLPREYIDTYHPKTIYVMVDGELKAQQVKVFSGIRIKPNTFRSAYQFWKKLV